MRHGAEGEWDFWGLYDAGEWEPETKATLERFLAPGDWFLDIGAWVGPVSMWAIELGAHVVAVEPDPKACEALKANVSDAWVVEKAVASSGEPVTLTAPNGVWGDSWTRVGEGSGLTVESITPADLLASMPTPALVKVDVEGWEIDVLPALVPLLRDLRVPLVCAWHEPWWPWHVEVRGWFDGFACEGEFGGWGSVVAVPE